MQEVGSRPDIEAASAAWQAHLKRNRSIVVDCMYGLLRSTLVCPTDGCGRVSETFDPYHVMTVPIPTAHSTRVLNVCPFIT